MSSYCFNLFEFYRTDKWHVVDHSNETDDITIAGDPMPIFKITECRFMPAPCQMKRTHHDECGGDSTASQIKNIPASRIFEFNKDDHR